MRGSVLRIVFPVTAASEVPKVVEPLIPTESTSLLTEEPAVASALLPPHAKENIPDDNCSCPLNRPFLPTVIKSNGAAYLDNEVLRQMSKFSTPKLVQSKAPGVLDSICEGIQEEGQIIEGTLGALKDMDEGREQSHRTLVVLVLHGTYVRGIGSNEHFFIDIVRYHKVLQNPR